MTMVFAIAGVVLILSDGIVDRVDEDFGFLAALLLVADAERVRDLVK
jgi:hypothetical protein